jgi:hypothetical protein
MVRMDDGNRHSVAVVSYDSLSALPNGTFLIRSRFCLLRQVFLETDVSGTLTQEPIV